jgi:hypothetical protein
MDHRPIVLRAQTFCVRRRTVRKNLESFRRGALRMAPLRADQARKRCVVGRDATAWHYRCMPLDANRRGMLATGVEDGEARNEHGGIYWDG